MITTCASLYAVYTINNLTLDKYICTGPANRDPHMRINDGRLECCLNMYLYGWQTHNTSRTTNTQDDTTVPTLLICYDIETALYERAGVEISRAALYYINHIVTAFVMWQSYVLVWQIFCEFKN